MDKCRAFIFVYCMLSCFLSRQVIAGKKDRALLRRNDRRTGEERLLAYLFDGYNLAARPVLNSNSTVSVQIQFSLMHIQELDVRGQILTATGLLILEWRDERLTWKKSDFNINEIIIEAKNIWVPEFAVINGADAIYGHYKEFRAIITNDGNVHWEPGGVFKTMCSIDITFFPFDEQTCALVFGAWSYHTTKMNMSNSGTTVNLDSYEPNGEWEIGSSNVVRDEFFYECCPLERFSNVAFLIHMKRRYTFYVMNVILPSMVTSILLLSIFYCPPGQKVQIGVVVLLSFRIFLLNVTDSIPKTSDHIPLLGIYLTCTMAITTLSMVLTVLVLNLHAISDRPVPRFLHVIIFHFLSRLCCKCHEARNLVESKAHLEKDHKRRKHRSPFTNSSVVDERMDEQVPIIAQNGTPLMETGFNNGSPHVGRDDFYPNGSVHSRQRTRKSLEAAAPAEKPDYSKDWQVLAEVVDRLFFWCFLLAIIGISLLLFHPLTKAFIENGHE